MRRFALLTALIATPAMIHAQPTASPADTSTMPVARPAYGPPAPTTPSMSGSRAPAARPAATTGDDTTSGPRRHGRRRGAYLGAEAGAMPR